MVMVAARRRIFVSWTAGLAGTLFIAATCFAAPGDLPHSVPALLLLVPIAVASSLGGWRVGVSIAVFAALVYCMAFLPPIGGVRIGLTEDVYVLIAFVAVAVFFSIVMGRRPPAGDPALLDDERAMLLRSVSHDLRAPLSTIHTVSTDLLDSDAYDPSTQRELMEMVVSESDRLNRIVGNLLSISRVQAGSFQPSVEATVVRTLVTTAVARIPESSRRTVRLEVADDLPEVLADPVQIDQVLANLLENALRHAPRGSAVTVGAARVGSMIELWVADDGPGFSATARSGGMVGSIRANGSGSGLGLTICRAIVEAHEGQLQIDSTAAGALVSFTLPVVPLTRANASRPGNMAET
jgi:K+-sensing histidine kinase KdpD